MLVQFGYNWIQKILLTAKLAILGIVFIQFFSKWTACSPFTYTNNRNTKIQQLEVKRNRH